MKKIKIGILGSTGSIGCNSLEVIRNLINNGIDIKIAFLTTNKQTELLKEQVKLYNPEFIFINDRKKSEEFIKGFTGNKTKVLNQYSDLLQIIRENDYDILINSINEKLMILPDDFTIYCGHGETTAIGFERRNNPFIKGESY